MLKAIYHHVPSMPKYYQDNGKLVWAFQNDRFYHAHMGLKEYKWTQVDGTNKCKRCGAEIPAAIALGFKLGIADGGSQ